jgi:plasmid stabilization system protein ParE
VRFGDESFSLRWKSHVIYWRRIDEATIEIVTVLHKAMDQPARLKADQSR